MSVSGRITVRTLRIDGNQRYSWIKNQRSLFASRTRPGTLRPQDDQLMASAAFSASSLLFDLKGAAKTASTKHSGAIMVH